MQKGIVSGISNEEYHSGPGISKSGLDLIHQQSPLHYWAAYVDPQREARKETAAFRLGNAIHTAILERDTYTDRYTVIPDGIDRRTKAGKELYDALVAEAAANGATLISPEENDTALRIASNALTHPLAKSIFSTGVAEQSVFWTDAETGILCKCRPDWLIDPNPNYAVLDVKSTADASPDGFMRSAYNYGYHRAAAWYLDGVEAATGNKPDAFMFLAVEKTAPFAVAFYYADDAMIELGRRECRAALRTYAECLNSGKWPGYTDRLVPLGLPRWAENLLIMAD